MIEQKKTDVFSIIQYWSDSSRKCKNMILIISIRTNVNIFLCSTLFYAEIKETGKELT